MAKVKINKISMYLFVKTTSEKSIVPCESTAKEFSFER